MSTRCQIMIEGHAPIIYRHCDGAPDTEHGVIAELLPILADFHSELGWSEEYMIARVAQRLMNLHVPGGDLSYGIGTHLYGAIEYLYIIHPDWSVTVRTPKSGFWDNPCLANTKQVARHKVL